MRLNRVERCCESGNAIPNKEQRGASDMGVWREARGQFVNKLASRREPSRQCPQKAGCVVAPKGREASLFQFSANGGDDATFNIAHGLEKRGVEFRGVLGQASGERRNIRLKIELKSSNEYRVTHIAVGASPVEQAIAKHDLQPFSFALKRAIYFVESLEETERIVGWSFRFLPEPTLMLPCSEGSDTPGIIFKTGFNIFAGYIPKRALGLKLRFGVNIFPSGLEPAGDFYWRRGNGLWIRTLDAQHDFIREASTLLRRFNIVVSSVVAVLRAGNIETGMFW